MNKSTIHSISNRLFNTDRILATKRMQWVDTLKGVAIILVVYRHVIIGLQRKELYVPEGLATANLLFYSFRMPLFFLLSGLFLYRSLKKRKASSLFESKFATLIYPYLVWTIIQITLQILVSDSAVTNSNRGWKDYLYILYQPRELDQFWYLPALFNATIVYLLLHSVLKLNKTIHILLAIGIYFSSFAFKDISMICDWMLFYPFLLLGALLSDFFFNENNTARIKKPWLFFAAIPFFILTQYLYLQHDEHYYTDTVAGKLLFIPISLTGSAMMLLLSFRLEQFSISKAFRVIGFHSLYIYVMHVQAASLWRTILMKFFGVTDAYVLLFSGIIFSVFVCICIYNLLIRNGPLWFLFSYRKKADEGA